MIMIWEKHDGGSNKFYTMIHLGKDTFQCNYGIDGGTGWHKTIVKDITLWAKTNENRRAHGYKCVLLADINIDRYLTLTEKIHTLYSLASDNDRILYLGYFLAKFGFLDGEQMKEANTLYKEFKA